MDVPPGGTLADYVPFYFTPRSPMLMNIRTGYLGLKKYPMDDIIIFASSHARLRRAGADFVFSDRNAALETAEITSDARQLATLPWASWQASDFRKDPARSDKVERYMAETLVHRHVPLAALEQIACYSEESRSVVVQQITRFAAEVETYVRPGWYC